MLDPLYQNFLLDPDLIKCMDPKLMDVHVYMDPILGQ